jgi:hypothetical protein
MSAFSNLPPEVLGQIGAFVPRTDLPNLRLVNRASSKIFSTRPLVVYRVRIMRTLTGGIPDGSSMVEVDGPFTLYSDATSTIPRGEDVQNMFRTIHDQTTSIFNSSPNPILATYLRQFREHPLGAAFEFEVRGFIFDLTFYLEDGKFDEDFSEHEFQSILASRMEESYTFSKTRSMPFFSYQLFETAETKLDKFLIKLQGRYGVEGKNNFVQVFTALGGLDKLKQILNFTLVTRLKVDRIANPPLY